MRWILLGLMALAFCNLSAQDLELSVDRSGAALHDFRTWCPGFGYAADPVVGGEKDILDCRHAGARLFRTVKCDKATLGFLKRGQMRALLILDGDERVIAENLRRIADGGFGSVIAGFQLGVRDDAASAAKWRTVLREIARLFPKKPIAVPAKDEKAQLASSLASTSKAVTHLVVDLGNGTGAEERISKFAAAQKRPLIAVVSGKTASGGGSLVVAGRKVCTLMSAIAAGRVDAVFFEQAPAPNSFGAALRYLGTAFEDYPLLVTHSWNRAKPVGTEATSAAEVKYLVLSDLRWKIACLVMVNTGKGPVKVRVKMEQGESMGCGTRRRIILDPETGKPVREALGCYATKGGPFTTELSAGEIAVVSFEVTRLKK